MNIIALSRPKPRKETTVGKVHDMHGPLVNEACARLQIERDTLHDVAWIDNDAGLIGKLATALDDALDCYDGAMEDCNSAVMVLIRRIKGEGSMAGAAEWVRSNYPALAREHGLLSLQPPAAKDSGRDE